MGIFNATNISLDNLTSLVNVTNPVQFLQNVNNIVYDGVLYFVLLWVLAFILFVVAQKSKDSILVNMMYSTAICSIAGFLLRGMSLMSDYQTAVFPLITILLALIVWATRDV